MLIRILKILDIRRIIWFIARERERERERERTSKKGLVFMFDILVNTNTVAQILHFFLYFSFYFFLKQDDFHKENENVVSH